VLPPAFARNHHAVTISKPQTAGPIPPSYGAATRLQHLHLRGHALSGPLPPLPATLQLLDVAHNQLSGTFPDLSGAKGLDYIDVSNNNLGGALPRTMASDNPAMDYLDASNNRIGGRLDEVSLPSGLTYADLSGNVIGGGLWASTEAFGSLAQLRLSHNSISGASQDEPAANEAGLLLCRARCIRV
jgi:Leucine-rich repeat (LRR) protein